MLHSVCRWIPMSIACSDLLFASNSNFPPIISQELMYCCLFFPRTFKTKTMKDFRLNKIMQLRNHLKKRENYSLKFTQRKAKF